MMISRARQLIPKTAPYGSWKSPITSGLIAAQSISLSEPRLDGEQALLASWKRRSA
jgi:hypothetical protein